MKNIIRIIRELLDKCDEEDFPTNQSFEYIDST